MDNWQKLEKKYFMHTVERVPLTLVKGSGAYVWSESGHRYLDFVGGWAVNSLGHCHPAIVKAVQKQLGQLIQTSNHYYTIPQVRLAQLLVDNSCLDKVFFCNSGAEATEGAVKLARRYGKLHLNGAYEVISATGSFHGRTLAMVSASGQSKHQQSYTPLPSGFINVEYNSMEAIKAATVEKTCAVMLEPVQGEGGVNIPQDDYLKEVRTWCDEKGILLILDEVQTGIGRTGPLFAYQQFGVEPDIMPLAKGLGSGIPIGAILAKNEVSVFAPGEHGSTFGGNPVACAAAYATVKYIIDNDIMSNVKNMSHYLIKGLEQLKARYNIITDVRGRGLLVAIGFDNDIALDLRKTCLDRRLLVNDVKADTLRLMPPLIIGKNEADEALATLDMVMA
jgi:acetylornithine/N-succinyldiaminopimelate aminotransferase